MFSGLFSGLMQQEKAPAADASSVVASVPTPSRAAARAASAESASSQVVPEQLPCDSDTAVPPQQVSPLDWEGHSWRVVHRTVVNVRSTPDRGADIIAKKKSGAVVWGTEADGWIQLEGEPGFMMIRNVNQGVLLRRTDEVASVTPIRDDGPCLPLLECPWREHLAQFASTHDLAMVAGASRSLRGELTVESDAPEQAGHRRLVAPLVELKMETAEAELGRVSLPHAQTVRLWSRLSFDALAAGVNSGGTKSLRSLEKLVVKGCNMYPHDVTSMLLPAMSVAEKLTTLNLEKNQLQDAMVVALVKSGALEAAPNLESLNIRFNRVGNEGAVALSKSPGAARLKWMNFKMNCIGDTGAVALAEMLQNNRSMTLLNLRKQSPGLTDVSALAFAETLRSNCVLEQLRLRRNRITDKGAAALAWAFQERLAGDVDRLELDLEDNRIKAAGALCLLRATCTVPPSVRLEVLLAGNTTGPDALREAAEAYALESCDQRFRVSDTRLTYVSKLEAVL